MNLIRKYFPIIFFVFSFLIFLKTFFLQTYPDFLVHYYSPIALLTGHSPYYSYNNIPFFPDVYPPVTILFFFPSVLFSLFLSEKIWFVISLVSLFLSVYFSFKIFNKNLFSWLGFIILGLIFLSFPVKFSFGMGQVNALILFLTTFSIFLYTKKKTVTSSLVLCLSIAMKFFPIFFPLYFLLIKKWKYFFSFLLLFLFIHLLIFIIYPSLVIDFYTKIIFSLIGGWKTDYYNQSLTGFIGRITLNQPFRESLRIATSLFFVLVTFFAILKTKGKEKFLHFHLSVLITLNLIVNSFSWQHHFVFMIYPFIVFLFYFLDSKNYKALIILFVSYLLISFNFKNPENFSPLLTSNVLYGAVLFWGLQIFILLRSSLKLQVNLPKDKIR